MRELDRVYGLGLGVVLVLSLVFLGGRYWSGDTSVAWGYGAVSDSILVAQRVHWDSVRNAKGKLPVRYVRRREVAVAPVELNSATPGELIAIKGIGEVLCKRIIDYRNALGGFAHKEQLLEIKGINQKNFSELSDKIFVDSDEIKKININFATRNALVKHPYMSQNMAVRITKGAKMKGVIVNNQQLIDNDILTPKEARILAPYLSYDTVIHQN